MPQAFPRRILLAAIASLVAATCLALSCGGSGTPTGSGGVLPPASGPQLSASLASNCFNWPSTEFSATNKASVQTLLAPAARAVEFTLNDVDGRQTPLSSLLAERPVLLVHGSLT